MPCNHIKVRPITPAIGAEISAVDLSLPLDDATFAEIHRAFLEHLVIVLRDQHITPEQQVAFTRRFGPVLRVPYVRHMEEHPDVIAVIKEADEQRVSVFGGDWHSDFSSLPEPPLATVLYAREVPPCGGDTLFANQYLAWESLSDGMRRMLEARRALHAGRPYGTRPAVDPERMLRSVHIDRGHAEADIERPHPIARTHPATGRRALYVNPIYTVRVEDLTEEESRPLLSQLYATATRPEFCCRVRWQPGTLVAWDNRCTLHYAVNDYDGHRRELHRTTAAGDAPR